MKTENLKSPQSQAEAAASQPWKQKEKLLKKLVPVELIQELGFAKAATDMGLSAQALYDRLRSLAEELQVDRDDIVTSGRDAIVGPVGQYVQALCADIDADIKAFREKVAKIRKDLPRNRTALRLAIVSSVWEQGETWMKREFEEAMPGMRLVGQPSLAGEVQPALLREEADIAIAYTPKFLDSRLAMTFWHEEELLLTVSEDFAKTRRFKEALVVTVADAGKIIGGLDDEKEKFFLMSQGADMTELVTDYFAEHRVKLPSARCLNVLTVVEALGKVHMKKGISILPRGNVLKNPGIVSFHLEPPLFRRFSIVYPVKTPKKNAVNAFVECVLRHNQSPA